MLVAARAVEVFPFAARVLEVFEREVRADSGCFSRDSSFADADLEGADFVEEALVAAREWVRWADLECADTVLWVVFLELDAFSGVVAAAKAAERLTSTETAAAKTAGARK